MAEPTITHFDPDSDRLALLRECTENYDVGDSESEWPNNILSRKTVVYGSGRIAREGDPVRHTVEPEELALCSRLSSEAEELMAGVDIGMGRSPAIRSGRSTSRRTRMTPCPRRSMRR